MVPEHFIFYILEYPSVIHQIKALTQGNKMELIKLDLAKVKWSFEPDLASRAFLRYCRNLPFSKMVTMSSKHLGFGKFQCLSLSTIPWLSNDVLIIALARL